MNGYKVIVPNLDRRPDRWKWCVKNLLEQGVPRDKIERFSAFDGLDYKGLPDWQRLFSDSLRAQFGTIPFFLNKKGREGSWAWARTWYTIIKRIADGSDTALVLVDDRAAMFAYGETCRHLEILNRQAHRLAMVQYSCHTGYVRTYRRSIRLDDIPEMQYGLYGCGDSVVLYTPLGARKMLDFINAPTLDGDGIIIYLRNDEYMSVGELRTKHRNPESISIALAVVGDPRGCYSTPEAKPLAQSQFMGDR